MSTTGDYRDPTTWRLSTGTGIPYKLLEVSGDFEAENASAREKYLMPANRLLDFAAECFPLPYFAFGTIFYPSRRRLPGLSPLVTTKVSWKAHVDGKPIDPFSTDSSAPDGTYGEVAEVDISYEVMPENDQERDPDDPFTFLEISGSASGEFLHGPVRGNALWVPWADESSLSSSSNQSSDLATGVSSKSSSWLHGSDREVREIDVPNTITQPTIEWSCRWPQIPFAWFNGTLLPRLRNKMGKVNDDVWVLFDSPAETVMFLGFTFREQFTWRTGYTGTPPIELELKFLEKNFETPEGVQVTHNHMYRPGYGWRRMEIDGDPLYELTDMDEIFKSSTP